MMQIGVSSYSFSRLVAEGKMKQLEVVEKAKEMGFDSIEFTLLDIPQGESVPSFASRVKEECDRYGMTVSAYAVGADFLNGSNGDWRAEADRLKEDILVMKILGAPMMRHDATSGYPAGHMGPKGFEDALPVLVQGYRAVTEYAAEHGIRTMVENHGYFCQDSERVEKLINGVNHPNFGALVDIGNFLCADEDPGNAVGRLAPYAIYVHAKDFHIKEGTLPDPGRGWFPSRGGRYLRGAIIGHGEVPVLQCLRTLKKAGYKGKISIEFEGLEDPITGISIGYENLKRYAASVDKQV